MLLKILPFTFIRRVCHDLLRNVRSASRLLRGELVVRGRFLWSGGDLTKPVLDLTDRSNE